MRTISLLGAPSNLGLKPYDDSGRARGVVDAPRVFRELGLAQRLGARDCGDVAAPAYDYAHRRNSIRNEASIARYSRALGDAVKRIRDDDHFALILGGDCSILLGTLLGCGEEVGLAFLDGHCDFATPEISHTGGAAGMDLALAVGRGGSPLSRLRNGRPLIDESRVVALCRKDLADEPYYGDDSIRNSRVLDLPWESAGAAEIALARLGDSPFVIHVDADVLDPEEMPAVDSPEPGGIQADELTRMLRTLARQPNAIALELTVYDPWLDEDRRCARLLADLLTSALT
ncbi:MAG TPA: arginase family protein [Thermoanaerobaculia bacterium]|jgi:arginase